MPAPANPPSERRTGQQRPPRPTEAVEPPRDWADGFSRAVAALREGLPARGETD